MKRPRLARVVLTVALAHNGSRWLFMREWETERAWEKAESRDKEVKRESEGWRRETWEVESRVRDGGERVLVAQAKEWRSNEKNQGHFGFDPLLIFWINFQLYFWNSSGLNTPNKNVNILVLSLLFPGKCNIFTYITCGD